MNRLLDSIPWSKIFQAQPGVGVAVISGDGVIEYCNQATCRLFGIPDCVAEVTGKSLHDIFHPLFADEKLRWIRDVIRSDRPLRGHFVYLGYQLVTSLYSLGDVEKEGVLAITVRDGGIDSSEMRAVSSDYIDLGELSPLSQRELEVLVLIGQGNSVPEVAKLLYRSPRTIERHKSEIGRKIGISSITEIASLVARAGLTYDQTQLTRLKASPRSQDSKPQEESPEASKSPEASNDANDGRAS